jgi:hypothetical protein
MGNDGFCAISLHHDEALMGSYHHSRSLLAKEMVKVFDLDMNRSRTTAWDSTDQEI